MRFSFLLLLLFLGVRTGSAGTGAPQKVAPTTPPTDAGPEELVARMTDPKASFQERCAAEDALTKVRPEAALPKLLPQLAKGMPEGGIWNSLGTREADRDAPIPWQIYYAVGRVWSQQIKALPRKEGGAVLVALLKSVTKDKEKYHVLSALGTRWDPSAEAELAKLLLDAGEPGDNRRAAALALIVHGKEDYRDAMLQAAAKADHGDQVRWYELLSDPQLKQRTGADPRVVRLGFKLIEAEKARSPDSIHGAYFLALKTGRYLGEEFAPNVRDPRYRGKEGRLSEQYFADTVSNALRWWDKNHERWEKK
jgi:hypothetical protein